MSILKIRTYPDKILRGKSEDVLELNSEIKILIQNMTETLSVKDGVGLAAPQVGVKKNLIVINIGQGPFVLINPKIINYSKELVIMSEGCLSVPKIEVKISRPEKIVVAGLNEYFKPVQFKATGLLARVIQHEIDHLFGILIIDKTNFLKKFLFSLKLRKMK